MKSGGYSHQSEKSAAKRTIVRRDVLANSAQHLLAGRFVRA